MVDIFAAQVADWAEKTEAEQTRILHASVRHLVEEVTRPKSAGGHMPVVKGNLRNSVAVSTTGPVAINFKTKRFSDPSESVNNAIAAIEVGAPAWIGFRAPYAHKAEVNNGFARLAGQRWPAVVAEALKDKG